MDVFELIGGDPEDSSEADESDEESTIDRIEVTYTETKDETFCSTLFRESVEPAKTIEVPAGADADEATGDEEEEEECPLGCFGEVGADEFNSIYVHHVIDTELPADSVECCPTVTKGTDGEETRLLACGTYALDAESGTKSGAVRLYRVVSTTQGSIASYLGALGSKAVFEIRWAFPNILGVVTANSTLDIYRIDASSSFAADSDESSTATEHAVELVASKSVGSDVLDCVHYTAIDFDGDKRESTTPGTSAIVSQSDGRMTLWSLDDGALRHRSRWLAHAYTGSAPAEIWCTVFDERDKRLVWSGADDCKLKSWDLRTPCRSAASETPQRVHEMGVTSVRTLEQNPSILVTGSYDERVRLFDVRNLRRPISTAAVDGGVWQLRTVPIPSAPKAVGIAAACMRGGVSVLDLTTSGLAVRASNAFSNALMYGIEHLGTFAAGSIQMVSCSFYEHELHFWSVGDSGCDGVVA